MVRAKQSATYLVLALMMFSASSAQSAPAQRPNILQAGDDCVMNKSFVVTTSPSGGKVIKVKIASGTRVRVVAIEKGAATVDSGGTRGSVPLPVLTKGCHLNARVEHSAAAPGEAPAPATPAGTPTVGPASSTAATTQGASDPADADAQKAVATHAAIVDELGGPVLPATQTNTAPMIASAHARRLAVYDLKLEGIDSRMGSLVTESLLAELRKLQGISAIGMDEVRDMLAFERSKDQMGCDDLTCLAEIGGALGVDELITGRLSRAGGGNVLLLRRIDQSHAQTLTTVNQRLEAGNGEEFLAAVGPAVDKLFPGQPLRPGATRGVAEEVALRLHPPPLAPWSFWAATSATAVAGVTAGVFALLANNAETRYQAQMQASTQQVTAAKPVTDLGREADRDARYANYSLIGAGAFAIAAGVMALFTDWHGYRDAAAQAQ